MTATDATRELATFVATLRFVDLPKLVVQRTEELFLDWFAAALAGRNARPVRALESFARNMGPPTGPSEILVSRRRNTPWFAALVNAASSHVVEQDDVHNGAVFHLGTVVFPAVLAVAQQTGANGREVIAASAAGYEAGVRIGEFLGRSHYRVFHTTGTAGTVAAAAAVERLLQLDAATTVHAFGSAGTQAAGLWEFLRDAADSKQLHTAKAAADGLLAAYLARDGFTGAQHILEGPQGMAAGMSSDADPARLTDQLGRRWAVTETSFKYHASCRHTHPAADALLKLMQKNRLPADRIGRVRAHVYQAAIDVLGPVINPQTVHQAKFSMGFVLALVAQHGRAGIDEFNDAALADPRLRALHDRVEMVLDPKIDALYPRQWAAQVDVETTNGERLSAFVDSPKGDPTNTLSRPEIEDKAQRLAAFEHGASSNEMRAVIARAWQLHEAAHVRDWLGKPA